MMEVLNVRLKRNEGVTISSFDPLLDTLRQLMLLRRGEVIAKLHDLGGIDNLCQRLRTSPTDGMNLQLIVTLYFNVCLNAILSYIYCILSSNILAIFFLTNVDLGLTGNPRDILERKLAFGDNIIPPKPPKSIPRLVLDAMRDWTIVILIVAAIVSLGVSFILPRYDAKCTC